ncbi:hypothetical protein ACGC1H_001736 [Rhizoctonia solani]
MQFALGLTLAQSNRIGNIAFSGSLVRNPFVLSLSSKFCNRELYKSKRTVLGEALVAHTLEIQRFAQAVNGHIYNLAPLGVQIVVLYFGSGHRNRIEHDAHVWVALSTKCGLDVLDILGAFDPEAYNTDWRRVRTCTLHAACHIEGLPADRNTGRDVLINVGSDRAQEYFDLFFSRVRLSIWINI